MSKTHSHKLKNRFPSLSALVDQETEKNVITLHKKNVGKNTLTQGSYIYSHDY